jgi:hypothetical protein
MVYSHRQTNEIPAKEKKLSAKRLSLIPCATPKQAQLPHTVFIIS